MIRHSLRTTSFLTVVTLSLSHAAAQVPVGQDTIVIPGDTFHGRLNAGLMETTINGDTTPTGARANPNRVYALNQGQYYHQLAPIYCYNPTGMLTICGIPSPYGTKCGSYAVNSPDCLRPMKSLGWRRWVRQRPFA